MNPLVLKIPNCKSKVIKNQMNHYFQPFTEKIKNLANNAQSVSNQIKL